MANPFFEKPILNSPYALPLRHWELDQHGQPTQQIIENRRRAEFITPIPKPRKRVASADQEEIVFDEGKGLSTKTQQYDPTPIINQLRQQVDQWRKLPNPNTWQVTPETARLLQHWRHHKFNSIRPFFCQVEAVETAIWLAEVAPQAGKTGKLLLEHLANANQDANPELSRLAFKLATGAGKTTVMAMLIAWQTINAVRRPQSQKFTRGFLIVAPGLTIKDDLLHLVVEIKGYRREDAKEKKSTMDTYWVPGVNQARQYGRWAFAEFTDIYLIDADFKAKVEGEFNQMLATVIKS